MQVYGDWREDKFVEVVMYKFDERAYKRTNYISAWPLRSILIFFYWPNELQTYCLTDSLIKLTNLGTHPPKETAALNR